MGPPRAEIDGMPGFCDAILWKGKCNGTEAVVKSQIWRAGIDHAYVIGLNENGNVICRAHADT